MNKSWVEIGRLLVILVCGCAGFLQAADKTWSGSTSASWGTANIWTPNGVPLATESVSVSNIVGSVSLTVQSGTAAVAASLSFDNTVNTNVTLTIADGGSLTVSGIITNPALNSAFWTVYNSSATNAASVLAASSMAARELALIAGAGPQYLTTGYDINYYTQLSINAGGLTQTNYYRQTNGTISIANSDYGLTLMLSNAGKPSASAAGFYILDGGTLKTDRIGVGNGNGNNNSINSWAGTGVLEFNNGTIQTRAAAGYVWIENGSTFETYNGSGPKDMQRNTSKPSTVRLSQNGTHTFNASFSDSSVVFSPSAQLADKPGETGTLTKTGPGNLIFTGGGLSATNTWTGDTTNTAGKVQVNYNLLAGTAGSLALNNAYSPRSKLILSGGGFELIGRSNAVFSTVSGRTLPSGGGFAESYLVTLASTAGLVVGQAVTNSFLPAGTYIRRIISGTQIGLSHMSTGTVSQTGQTLDFGAASFTSAQTVSNVELVAAASPVTVTPGGSSTLLTFVNVSGAGGLNKAGAGTLQLTGAITFAGTNTISAGMLDFASGANITLTNAITGSGIFRQSGAGTTAVDAATASINSFSGAVVVDGGTLRQGSGSANQNRGLTSASSYTINSGAMILTARDAMSSGATYNLNGGTFRIAPGGGAQTLGPVTLNGGTMVTCQGMGGPWNAFMCNGDFAVTGTVPSVIRADPGLYNGVHLTFNTTSGPRSRVFRVEDVTGNADADLTISASLLDSSHTNVIANLIKTGAGTLLLAGGTNIYSGATIVSNGTLLVSGGMSNSAVTVVSGAAFGTADTKVSKVASLTVAQGAKVIWKYDGGTHSAGNIVVLGALNLPSVATLDVSGTGYLYSSQTLFSATTITGATDLSGWTITGATANSRLIVDGTAVKLIVSHGTLIRIK